MANLAEKHDEEQSGQLADAEISRILSALQKAEFKRSETGNELPDQTFKPRSLMEIAETAKKHDDVGEADEIPAEIAASAATPEPGEIIDESSTNDMASEVRANDPSDAQESSDLLDNGQQYAGMELSPKEPSSSGSKELPITDGDLSSDVGVDSSADDEASTASPNSPFETAQAAYDRGYGDGIEAGREAADGELRSALEAEFETKFSDKVSAFETALFGLAKPQTVDTDALSRSLHEAVIRLAAARIGAAIDEMPELMVARIETLADAAGKNVTMGQVFMHPDDCAVISPVMAARQDPVMIEADPQLCRGDIRIRFDGMDISDVAELRADWKISKEVTAENSAKAEPVQSENSEAQQVIQSSENLSEDSPNVSVQSNIAHSSMTDNENIGPLADSLDENGDDPASETVGLMPLTSTFGENVGPDEGAEDNEETSASEAVGLMPLTTTGGEDTTSDEGTEDNEETSASEAVGLMPLTTTGGEDTTPEEGTEENEETSASEAAGLMPLTTTGGEDTTQGEATDTNEGTPNSNPIGLMPLTSKKFDE